MRRLNAGGLVPPSREQIRADSGFAKELRLRLLTSQQFRPTRP